MHIKNTLFIRLCCLLLHLATVVTPNNNVNFNNWRSCAVLLWRQAWLCGKPCGRPYIRFQRSTRSLAACCNIAAVEIRQHRTLFTSTHRLNMKVDLQSLFGLNVWDPATPPLPLPPHWDSNTRALLVSKDRRHLISLLLPLDFFSCSTKDHWKCEI